MKNNFFVEKAQPIKLAFGKLNHEKARKPVSEKFHFDLIQSLLLDIAKNSLRHSNNPLLGAKEKAKASIANSVLNSELPLFDKRRLLENLQIDVFAQYVRELADVDSDSQPCRVQEFYKGAIEVNELIKNSPIKDNLLNKMIEHFAS